MDVLGDSSWWSRAGCCGAGWGGAWSIDPSTHASAGVSCAFPFALTDILLSSLLSTILRPLDRAPRGNRGAGMLVRLEMGRVDEEFSRCGPSFDCPAGLMDALR